jgi:hypothetical protein
LKPSALSSQKETGPIRGLRRQTAVGQLEAIGIVFSERNWANSMQSAAQRQTSCGSSGCYRQYLVTGQPNAIDSTSFMTSTANSAPSVDLVLNYSGLSGAHLSAATGHLHSIVITFSERDRANSVLSAAQLQISCGPSGYYQQYLVTGQLNAIGSTSFMTSMANSAPSVDLVLNYYGLSGAHRSAATGQLHSIVITFSERDWANSVLSAAQLQISCGPSGYYQQYLVTGQLNAIGSTSFMTSMANSAPSVDLVLNYSGLSGAHRSAATGQLHSIVITFSEWDWANSVLSAAQLQISCGPSGCYRQYLVTGQPNATGSTLLMTSMANPAPSADLVLIILGHQERIVQQLLANSIPSSLPSQSGTGPTRCYLQHSFRSPVGHQDVIDSTW